MPNRNNDTVAVMTAANVSVSWRERLAHISRNM